MNNKSIKKLLLIVIILLISVNYLIRDNVSNSDIKSIEEVVKLREQYANYLKNSPFKNTLNLSKSERKAIGIPPNKYYERQWELTIDPSTGKTHPERLFALQESLKLKGLTCFSSQASGDLTSSISYVLYFINILFI